MITKQEWAFQKKLAIFQHLTNSKVGFPLVNESTEPIWKQFQTKEMIC